MFGWRKRDQGFEWRKYVRTTILVRRKQRKEKIEDAKQAAVAGLKEAGRKGVEAGASGVSAARGWLSAGFDRGGAALGAGLNRIGAGLGSASAGSARMLRAAGQRLGPAASALSRASAPASELLGSPGVALSLGLVAAVCLLAGGARAITQGLDFEAALPLGVAAVSAVLLLVGRAEVVVGVLSAVGSRLPEGLRRIPGLAVAGGLVAVLAIGGGAWWMTARGPTSAATALDKGQAVPAKSTGTIAGRAIARTGDTLRIGAVTLKLTGIEAPHSEQTCTKGAGGRRWKCGEAAVQALKSIVGSKIVACEITAREEAGRASGSCRADGIDIGGELVKGGHVFAERGLFSRYGSLEGEAMAAKAGLWSGEAERPADYRAKRWEDAKRSAPDGCPIKALVSSEGRIYVLPWSRTYDRVKVRSGRGERWFCSEAEAQAAGWRPTDKS